MIDIIEYKGEVYPKFQSEGFAAKYAIPFAQEVCSGEGYDIGCNRLEWAYKDKEGKSAIPIDPVIDPTFDAYKLPVGRVDYVFSSHATEHFPDWVKALDYWQEKLKRGGTLFLYLPDFSQHYWRVWNNRKHIHTFTPEILRAYLEDRGWQKIFVSGVDLNNSFIAMAEK